MSFLAKKNVYILSVVTKFIIVIFSFLSSVIVNRYLGPNLKGQYAYIFNFVGILSLIINLGIGQSYTFFKKNMGEKISQHFITIYYFQLLFYIICIVVLNIFYNNFMLNIVLIISIIVQFNSQISFMSLVNDVNKRNIVNIFTALFYLLFLLVIYFKTNIYLNLLIIAFICKLIFDSTFLIVQNKIIPTSSFIDFRLLKKILKFGFFPMITSLLITLNYSIDIIILKYFVNYSTIGIYSVGVALAGMLWIVPDAFKDVLFNKTAKNDSISDIKFAIKFNIYLCLIIIAGFIIFGRKFIFIFYGKEYLDAYYVSLLLFFGCIPMILFKMINTLYISIGKQKFAFYILMIAVFGNVLGNYFLIPRMGIEGAAIASIISYSICGIIFLVSFMRKYNISIKEIVFFDSNEKLRVYNVLKNF